MSDDPNETDIMFMFITAMVGFGILTVVVSLGALAYMFPVGFLGGVGVGVLSYGIGYFAMQWLEKHEDKSGSDVIIGARLYKGFYGGLEKSVEKFEDPTKPAVRLKEWDVYEDT